MLTGRVKKHVRKNASRNDIAHADGKEIITFCKKMKSADIPKIQKKQKIFDLEKACV